MKCILYKGDMKWDTHVNCMSDLIHERYDKIEIVKWYDNFKHTKAYLKYVEWCIEDSPFELNDGTVSFNSTKGNLGLVFDVTKDTGIRIMHMINAIRAPAMKYRLCGKGFGKMYKDLGPAGVLMACTYLYGPEPGSGLSYILAAGNADMIYVPGNLAKPSHKFMIKYYEWLIGGLDEPIKYYNTRMLGSGLRIVDVNVSSISIEGVSPVIPPSKVNVPYGRMWVSFSNSEWDYSYFKKLVNGATAEELKEEYKNAAVHGKELFRKVEAELAKEY